MDTIAQYLAGELPFEAAARAISTSQEFTMVQVRPLKGADPAVRARATRLKALFARVQAINAAEQLLERAAIAPRIDDWSAPSDQTDFCFSVEVVLTGRDTQQVYSASYRLYVCTPAWIARHVREMGPRWVTAPLVLPHWHPRLVHGALDELVHGAHDDKWWQFVARMSRVLEVEG